MVDLPRDLIEKCKERLLQNKENILNRVKSVRHNLYNDDRGGDEADQTQRVLAERDLINETDRLRQQLVEIEFALARIAGGNYGVCEETEEPIEPERLLAIPWTRLSIEGAEIRESLQKKYAR
jgi:DnaK suppressor protein